MTLPDPTPDFDGRTYDRALDYERLGKQARRVFDAMRDGGWHTLHDLARRTGDPEASISARLRDFRKPRWGQFVVERDRLTDESGTFVYRLLLPDDVPPPAEPTLF